MKITIFGASGSVGQYLIDEAVKRGHKVIAVSRDHNRISKQNSNVTAMSVDYTDFNSIEQTLIGSDAVIISLGDFNVAQPTEAILKAMKRQNVKRVELLTGFGTSSISRRKLNLVMQVTMQLVRLLSLPGFLSKEKQDQLTRNSGLDFTIIQPPTLTFASPTGNYRHGDYKGKSIFGKISRADLAEFIINNLENKRYINESVYVQQ